MGNCPTQSSPSLLDRTSALMLKNDNKRTRTLQELLETLNPSDPQTNKTRSQAVLNNKAVMDVLLDLSATTGVAENALGVLVRLSWDKDNAKRLFRERPGLVPMLQLKTETSEQVQTSALFVLYNLAFNNDNAREMGTALVPLLMAKVESNSEEVQNKALCVLNSLAVDAGNAREMVTKNPRLVPLLVVKMNESIALPAIRVVYHLSCSPANRAVLRGNNSVVDALSKGRKSMNTSTSFFSLLALVNVFGAEEDFKVLKTDLTTLVRIFRLIAHAMNKQGWNLNEPLLAFRYLCVVEHNRRLLWNKYESEFLTTILAALQQAIDDKNAPAAENAVSTLALFSNDPEPLGWIHRNKPRLVELIAQLAPFSEVSKTVEVLWFTLDPPEVAVAPAGSKPTIMISYNWKHQAQARLIHLLLEAQGYPVWRDEQHMKADTLTLLMDAVSKSTVVLVLVSPWYKESANCQMECKFAHHNNRKLIPVLVEPGYVFKLDGWLGLLLGSKLYYDVSGFHNEAQMKPVVLNLLRMEVEGGQGAATVAPPVAATPKQPVLPSVAAAPKQPVPRPVAATSNPPVPQNEKEIRQWLSKYEHSEEIANKLVKEGLVNIKALEMLSKKSAAELKTLVELNAMQALTLEAALKELF